MSLSGVTALLAIGPVTKKHFQLAGATAVAGAVLAAGGKLTGFSLVYYCGLFLLFAGAVQLAAFGAMLKKYGWQEEQGATTTAYDCQHCGARFDTYEAADRHEQNCPRLGDPNPMTVPAFVPAQGPQSVAPQLVGMPVGVAPAAGQQPDGTFSQPQDPYFAYRPQPSGPRPQEYLGKE